MKYQIKRFVQCALPLQCQLTIISSQHTLDTLNVQAAWETARQDRLATLKMLQSQSLCMVGDAQKQAVQIGLTDGQQTQQFAQVWEAIATTTVARQQAALREKRLLEAVSDKTTRDERAIFRKEVNTAAALHTRRIARRERLDRGRSHSSERQSTRKSRPSSARASQFYGPHSVDVVSQDLSDDGSVITRSLRRIKQDGTPQYSSVVRKSVAVVRSPRPQRPAGGDASANSDDDHFSASDAASIESQRLHRRRVDAGVASLRRHSDASERGRKAGAKIRQLAEGDVTLQQLEYIDQEQRGASRSKSRSVSPSGGTTSDRGMYAAPLSGPLGTGETYRRAQHLGHMQPEDAAAFMAKAYLAYPSTVARDRLLSQRIASSRNGAGVEVVSGLSMPQPGAFANQLHASYVSIPSAAFAPPQDSAASGALDGDKSHRVEPSQSALNFAFESLFAGSQSGSVVSSARSHNQRIVQPEFSVRTVSSRSRASTTASTA
jgi:hypothetical protein